MAAREDRSQKTEYRSQEKEARRLRVLKQFVIPMKMGIQKEP